MTNSERKIKFRSTKTWKDFRAKKLLEQKIDPITGAKLGKHAHLHHCDLDETHYEDISNEDNFICLNEMSHKCIHFLFSRKDPKLWRKRIINIIHILKKMEKINAKE